MKMVETFNGIEISTNNNGKVEKVRLNNDEVEKLIRQLNDKDAIFKSRVMNTKTTIDVFAMEDSEF